MVPESIHERATEVAEIAAVQPLFAEAVLIDFAAVVCDNDAVDPLTSSWILALFCLAH